MRKWQTIKEYEDIKFDFFEGIAKITINRPRVYNAFRPQTNKEMLDAMTICRERNDIGVVVLTGAGDKAFCSGGDQHVKGVGGYIFIPQCVGIVQKTHIPGDQRCYSFPHQGSPHSC